MILLAFFDCQGAKSLYNNQTTLISANWRFAEDTAYKEDFECFTEEESLKYIEDYSPAI